MRKLFLTLISISILPITLYAIRPPSSGGGSSNVAIIDDLTDVDVSTAATSNVLTKRGDGTWVGSTIAGTGDVVAASDNAFSGNNTMSGNLTLTDTSTLTVRSTGFSVGESKLAVTNTGVGVGTSNPAAGMHVSGTLIRVSSATNATTYGLMNSVTSASGQLTDSNVGDFVYGMNGPNRILIGRLGSYSSIAVRGGQVGVGQTDPSYRLHVSSTGGETGTIFAVSTGAVDLFRVLGTSVNLKVPLIFPDGTAQVSAASGSGGGTNMNPTTTTISLGGSYSVVQATAIRSNNEFSVADATFTVTAGKIGIGTTNPASTFDVFVTTLVIDRGKLGVGTATPTRTLHVNQNQGTTGIVMAVSTGTTDLFGVGGSSVFVKVPLYFQDGTALNSASGVQSQWTTNGSNIGYTGGKVAVGVTNPSYALQVTTAAGTTGGLFSVATGTVDLFMVTGTSVNVTVPAYFYSDISMKASGSSIISATPTLRMTMNTANYDFYPGSMTIPGSIGTSANPNALLPGTTVWTFSTPVKSTGNVRASNIGLAQWVIHLSSDTLAAGCTYWVGEAPSDTSITITSVKARTYSVAASSANYSLQEKTDQSANGSQIFTGTYSTGTWSGGSPITSFADSSIAAGSQVYFVTKDGGATAGTPRGLSVIITYKYDNP